MDGGTRVSRWQADKEWSDGLLTEIKSILGVHLIGEPPVEEDAERNTDLMVLRMDAVRIGCRIRRNNQIGYIDEFTIRTSRPSGVKTELAKIIEGWGDFFFYGFADETGSRLAAWTLADLKVFRGQYARMLVKCAPGKVPGIMKVNKDNSSNFAVFRWDAFPREFVVASSRLGRMAAA